MSIFSIKYTRRQCISNNSIAMHKQLRLKNHTF
jgi:hypothetical protein